MKLAPLLAQYLYTTKRLDLPGIGSFILDGSIVSEPDSTRSQKPMIIDGISFESNPSVKEAGDLIGYISVQTGKMKALAAADLSSHLELVQQFLNIGKPFLLEGIGSLVKIRSGHYEFTSGVIHPEKSKDITAKENAATAASEESFSSIEDHGAGKSFSIGWTKPVMALLIIAGAGLAIWGGYTIYKKNAPAPTLSVSTVVDPVDTIPVKDTTTQAHAATAVAHAVAVENHPYSAPSGNYKFVLETASKTRAFDRYQRLKAYQWNIQMETLDSVKYKLFLAFPVAPADTSRVLDSLTALNGRKVYIEM